MEATSPWVTVLVAAIAAFGGAPLFTYLAERIKGRAAVQRSERDTLEREREEMRQERAALWAERQRLAQSDRLELKTLRDAYNDVVNLNGQLIGKLARADERIDELEAEIKMLRGASHDER